MESMATFLSDNASAVFGLMGALGGVFLTFITGWVLKKRDYDLRLWDRLLERRIASHDDLMQVANEMRMMASLRGVDETGEVARTPQVLVSREVFEGWMRRAIEKLVGGAAWLTTSAKREANLIQDYLVTLHLYLEGVPSSRFEEVGTIVRQDFIMLSSSLEKVAHAFFKKGVRKLQVGNLDDWHKYPREETERRLKDTQLLVRSKNIVAMREQGPIT